MYCEANDLLKLPPITVDPESEQLLDNHKSLNNLDELAKTLQAHLSSTRASLSKELYSNRQRANCQVAQNLL